MRFGSGSGIEKGDRTPTETPPNPRRTLGGPSSTHVEVSYLVAGLVY